LVFGQPLPVELLYVFGAVMILQTIVEYCLPRKGRLWRSTYPQERYQNGLGVEGFFLPENAIAY